MAVKAREGRDTPLRGAAALAGAAAITTGRVTRDASREATRDGAPPIDLIDGDQLVEKLKELGLGVSVTPRVIEDVEVDHDWFESL